MPGLLQRPDKFSACQGRSGKGSWGDSIHSPHFLKEGSSAFRCVSVCVDLIGLIISAGTGQARLCAFYLPLLPPGMRLPCRQGSLCVQAGGAGSSLCWGYPSTKMVWASALSIPQSRANPNIWRGRRGGLYLCWKYPHKALASPLFPSECKLTPARDTRPSGLTVLQDWEPPSRASTGLYQSSSVRKRAMRLVSGH